MANSFGNSKHLTKKDYLNLFGATAIALIAAVLVLVTTLDLFASLVVFFLCLSAAIFSRSFSRGFLLVFLVLLISPTYKIASGKIVSFDLILALLVIVGMIKISGEKIRFKMSSVPFSVRMLFLTILGLIFSGFTFEIKFNGNFWLSAGLALLIFLFVVFIGFFFQTRKRTELVIKTIIFSAVCHSFFGLVAFLSNWQWLSGLSWTKKASFFPLSKEIENQAIGLFGTDLFLRLGSLSSPMAELLLISIPLTIGLLLNLKTKSTKAIPSLLDSTFSFDPDNFKPNPVLGNKKNFSSAGSLLAKGKTFLKKLPITRIAKKILLVFFQKAKPFVKWLSKSFFPVQNAFRLWRSFEQIKKEFFTKKAILLLFFLFLQITGLVVTFSYFHFIFLLVGLLMMAILLRKKQAALGIAGLILVLFFLPTALKDQPEISFYFSESFRQVSRLKDYWFLGAGWRVSKEIENVGKISNSYLYFWNTFGFLGLITIVAILANFFGQIRKTYLVSDGKERNLIIAILGAFIGFSLGGFFLMPFFLVQPPWLFGQCMPWHSTCEKGRWFLE